MVMTSKIPLPFTLQIQRKIVGLGFFDARGLFAQIRQKPVSDRDPVANNLKLILLLL